MRPIPPGRSFGPPGGPAPRRAPLGHAAACLAMALALLLASCAGGVAPGPSLPAPPAASARPPKLAPPPALPPGWAELPPEAQAFAEEWRRAAAAGDWAWIASRADPSFKAAFPGGGAKDGAYLARLLRSGELAAGAPEEGRGFSPLDAAAVRGLRFEEARLRGPVAIIYGSFILRDGTQTPFALHILWRMEPPLILGDRP